MDFVKRVLLQDMDEYYDPIDDNPYIPPEVPDCQVDPEQFAEELLADIERALDDDSSRGLASRLHPDNSRWEEEGE